MVSSDFDVVIVGGGIVGAALALALRHSGLNLALIEPHPITCLSEDWDTRIYAISPGNADFLKRLGVWGNLDMSRVSPVYAMDVHGDQGGRVLLDAYQAGVPQLAWILESKRLQYALWQALKTQTNVCLFEGVQGESLHWGADSTRVVQGSSARHVQLKLQDGFTLDTDLVVAADGRQSWVREHSGIASTHTDYQQLGVVANFSCELAHRDVARQWFDAQGVLAWLPLPAQHISMVWSTDAQHTHLLMTDSPAQLAERVAKGGKHSLGRLTLQGAPVAFPLSLMRASTIVAPGLALVGDAAHGVHPLAGQGVNLGLRDVASLAQQLMQRGAAHCGEVTLLQRYARVRRGDILSIQSVTHGLHHLFQAQHPFLALWRNQGMNWVQNFPPLKSWLIKQSLV